jgi:hypothetical protein
MSYLTSAPPKVSSDEHPAEDAIMTELHAFREQYAAQFDYDWSRIFADLKRRAEQDPFVQQLRQKGSQSVNHG